MLSLFLPDGSAQASGSQVERSMHGGHVEETPNRKDAGNSEPDGDGSRPSPDQASCLLRTLVTKTSNETEAMVSLITKIFRICSSFYIL